MTDHEYRQMVEQKYGMPLKDLMYEVCMRSEMDTYEAALELGVPHETFMEWRSAYHLGPYQSPAVTAGSEKSLHGFEELARQMLELEKEKLKKSQDKSPLERVNVHLWESILYCLDAYKDGTLQERHDELLHNTKSKGH